VTWRDYTGLDRLVPGSWVGRSDRLRARRAQCRTAVPWGPVRAPQRPVRRDRRGDARGGL